MMQGDNGARRANLLVELLAAISDSFKRDRTARLVWLEERLARLSRWTTIAIAMALAYFSYQVWGEVHTELSDYRPGQVTLAATDTVDEARTSIFLIFAAALGGPVVLVAGYLVIGFIYNVLHDALIRRVPLARFMVLPVLLLMGLQLLESRRDELKQTLSAGYETVVWHIDTALSLRQQARAAGEKINELRQLESQLRELNDTPATGSGSTGASQETAQSAQGEAVAQDEAVRRLGELMLQLQGLPLPPSDPTAAHDSVTPTPNQTVDTPFPTPAGNATPAAPAGI